MNKKHIILIILFIQGIFVFATVQLPDVLIYNGRQYMIWEEPMEYYFNQFPEKRPQWRSTNLWRCYIATFEIIQNELWVIDIKDSNNVSIINDVLNGNDRMKIDWYNGIIGLFIDNRHDRRVGSYAYIFYTVLEINNGHFQNEIIMNERQYFELRRQRR